MVRNTNGSDTDLLAATGWKVVRPVFLQDVLDHFLICLRDGKICYLSPKILTMMPRIGVDNLIKGAALTELEVCKKALLSIGLVRWNQLHAASSIIPGRNPHCGPAFKEGGDLAKWDSQACLFVHH